jgi:hypothetical protein
MIRSVFNARKQTSGDKKKDRDVCILLKCRCCIESFIFTALFPAPGYTEFIRKGDPAFI